LVNEAPAEWCDASVVPPSIADAAQRAALDEAAALLVPGLRPAARRLLARLRPGALAALDGAGGLHAALAAVDGAAAGLQTLLAAAARAGRGGEPAGAPAPPGAREALAAAAAVWLSALRAAMPAIGQQSAAADARLAEMAVAGLAAAALAEGGDEGAPRGACGHAAGGDADAGGAAAVLLELLARPSTRNGALSRLLALLDGASPGGAARLALAAPVFEALATRRLQDPRTRRAAAAALLAALRAAAAEGGAATAAAASAAERWRAWAECYRGDPQAPALSECFDAVAERAPGPAAAAPAAGAAAWGPRVEALARRLFCRDAEERRAAGRELMRGFAPGLADDAGAGSSDLGARRRMGHRGQGNLPCAAGFGTAGAVCGCWAHAGRLAGCACLPSSAPTFNPTARPQRTRSAACSTPAARAPAPAPRGRTPSWMRRRRWRPALLARTRRGCWRWSTTGEGAAG
jgi:hypothetical protein